MSSTPIRRTLRTAHQSVWLCEPFTASNLVGTHDNLGVGQLPTAFHNSFHRAARVDGFFAVYSYGTPIAWHVNGTWTVPDVSYSPTTARQLAALGIRTGRTSAAAAAKVPALVHECINEAGPCRFCAASVPTLYHPTPA